MDNYNARELLEIHPLDFGNSFPDRYAVTFEDGVTLNVTNREMIYTRFFWEIFIYYAKAPICSTHHVQSVLKGQALNSRTHIDLLGKIAKDVIEVYGLNEPQDKEHILGMIYEITNQVHNEVSRIAEQDVASIDILDFLEVTEHPVIVDAISQLDSKHESIALAYDTILKFLNRSDDFKNNQLVNAIKSKMVNANQVCQCVITRGFITEVDGSILPVPILTNYTKGLNSLYHYMAESRSAAKSLYFSEAPLQDAEYFARRLQLLSMSVEKIAYQDCGSTQYIQWRVNPPVRDESGKVTYQGDLKFMVGKYYLNEETGKLDCIQGDDPTLYNKVLKIRSVLYCEHKDPHSVCEVCFGKLAKNISKYANIGHLCAATMTQQTSQSVLSTKHLDASSVSANIVLGEASTPYLTTNRAKNAYLIKKELKAKSVKMVVSRDEAVGLTDILNIDDVDNINPIRVSNITCIEICFINKKEETCVPIFVNQGNRKAVLTSEFLKHLKTHRWSVDNRNNFIFDLKDWNFALPILKLPDMEYSFSDHSHQIAKVIESNMKSISDRITPHSPISTLQELFALVNAKLNVNIAALEVIVYANMVKSKSTYGMGRNVTHPVLGVSDLIVKNRSLGPALSYENQCGTITDPKSFFKLDRNDSVFDTFICPAQVIAEYKGREQ